jgi:transposase
MCEVMEVIHQWHQGHKIKEIQRSLGADRKTIRKYVKMGQKLGVERGKPLEDARQLVSEIEKLCRSSVVYQEPAMEKIALFEEDIRIWLKDEDITAKQIWRLLQEKGLQTGYSSVKRYLRKTFSFNAPEVTVRLETPPARQAQVDFGYGRLLYDPETERERRAWMFLMTLSWSRHRFVRFVFRMDASTWIDCHVRAFQFFGGVPETVLLDNLKTGVLKADLYDPTINRAYADLERYYGFVADPARLADPKMKGKVERGVPTVRQQILAGRSFGDIHEANRYALHWCREIVGRAIHGTTKRMPYSVFLEEEQSQLKPLPDEPFEMPLWKECTVHPDHHIVFDRSYYSLPTRYIGKKVFARGTKTVVRIFLDQELIKVHGRAARPGTWVTDESDYPPGKLAYLMATPTYCRDKAAEYGPSTEKLVSMILGDHAMRNLRKAQAILRLGAKYGADLERAAERAVLFGNTRYKSLKLILEKGLSSPEGKKEDRKKELPLSALGKSFLRPLTYYIPARREVVS